MSGVLVVPDVGEAASSVVTVICGGVPSDSAWDFVEPQSFSFSKKHNFACGRAEGHEFRRNAGKVPSLL